MSQVSHRKKSADIAVGAYRLAVTYEYGEGGRVKCELRERHNNNDVSGEIACGFGENESEARSGAVSSLMSDIGSGLR